MPNESFKVSGRKRRESVSYICKMQPCEKLSGNLALTENRRRFKPTGVREISHKCLYVKSYWAIKGRRQSLLDMSAFLKRSEERRVGKECRSLWSPHQY